MKIEEYKRDMYIINKENRCRSQAGQLDIVKTDIRQAINGNEFALKINWNYYINYLYSNDINSNWKTLARLNVLYNTKEYLALLFAIKELQKEYRERANRQRKILIKIKEAKQ